MCGITGYFSSNKQISCKKFYKVHKLIAHRGPDDEGFLVKQNNKLIMAKGDDSIKEYNCLPHLSTFQNSNLILGHRRLSIIDLSASGHQPFIYEHLSMVYNGEVYNYIELKKELEKLGYQFETKTDTEVVLKAFHKWGYEAFNKFNGMWALAIYNKKENKLILSRDRFGIKPLFYYKSNNGFYFASEMKVLLEFISKRKVNKEMAIDYLKNNYLLHTEETMFEGIFQVMPSHYYVINNNLFLEKFRYWKLKLNKKNYTQDDIKNILVDSIKLRLRADVKIGALLSGGVDSSVLVGLMDKKLNLNNLETFSAIFKGYEYYSEENLIEKNISLLTVKNNLVNITYNEIEKNIDKLFVIHEIPIRSLAIYSQYALYRYIKDNTDIKVVINGQGADEIFSGYSDHIFYYILSLLENLKIKEVFKEINLYSHFSNKKIKDVLKQLIKLWVKNKLVNRIPSKYSLPQTKIKYKNYFNDIFLNKLYHDLTFSALKEYLYYDDRNSMHFSLESRLPYLDYRLVEIAYNLSNKQKINQGITKKILREIGKNYVHQNIINNKIKRGFISPQEYWQRNELKPLFDKSFEDIKTNGIFSFLDNKSFYKYYKLYQENQFNDWTFIWRIYSLYKWKEIWRVKDE